MFVWKDENIEKRLGMAHLKNNNYFSIASLGQSKICLWQRLKDKQREID